MNSKLQARINAIRARAALTLAPPALKTRILVPGEKLHICGLIRAREVPFETEAEWAYWWLCERNLSGKIIRPARMSDREKERYTVAACENILVSSGITQVLNYIGSTSGNSTGFAQYFAVGNVAISSVQSNDTSVAGEYFRAVPSAANVTGVQIDLSTFFASGSGNGSITNAGLFGNGASGTLGSGTLFTHSPFAYTKLNGTPITADYLLQYV